MKFVVLLLFGPLAASSFTSLCPQQPNNVVVNCNNGQNPFPFPTIPGTTIPIRGRVLDVGYETLPRGSKLEFQRRRTDSSEESSESESDESSEEIVDHQIPFYPTHSVNHQHVPSIHSTTTVDNKLDFLRHGTGGVFRNNVRTFPRRNDIRRYISSTRDNLNVASGLPIVDETHGHGHSGQYNHNVHNYEHGHHHEHNHGHNHHHDGGHNHHHDGHRHHSHEHVPTHITYPVNTVVGTHLIPEHSLPMGSILSGATTDIVVNNQGNINMDGGEPRIDSPIVQLSAVRPSLGPNNRAESVLQDSHDRLVLTQRGYRALGDPSVSKTTYELESLLSSIVPMISVPTVHQDGLNTEINCDPIPIDSTITQTTGAQGTEGQIPLNGFTSTMGQSDMLPDQQISSTFHITGNAQDVSQISNVESTVTKLEERPMTTGIRNPMEESSGTTVTKVTTTKIEKRPTVENTHIGSTVTKVTTTKTEERPMSSQVVVPSEQHMGSTVTKVTTTTSEKLPIEGTAGQTSSSSGSTITTVTTTKTEGRPINTVISSIPETIVHETPVHTSSSSGSTITKVTTTKTESRPIITDITIPETIVNERPVQTSSNSGSTITTVTTTNTEELPIHTDITLPEIIVHETPAENGDSTSSKVTTTTTTEEKPITTQLTEVIGGKDEVFLTLIFL